MKKRTMLENGQERKQRIVDDGELRCVEQKASSDLGG